MIYTFGDEMHANARWYAIAFAMDKKFDKSKLVEFLVYPIGFCRNSAGGDLSAKRRRKRLARTNKIVGFSTKYTKKTTLAGVAFLWRGDKKDILPF